jgi:uncharacterized protein YdaU (DUF1376 family)
MHYYERHIGDYLKDTAHLSLLEHGAYARLMDVYYTREGAIPEKDVNRLIGARTKDERQAMQDVLTEFFELVDGHYVQARCDREIARFKEKQAKARKSAEARWGQQPLPLASNANAPKSGANASSRADAQAMRTHSEGNATRAPVPSPIPKPNNQTPSGEGSESLEETTPARAAAAVAIPEDWQPPDWVPTRLTMAGVAFRPQASHVAQFIAQQRAAGAIRQPRQWGEAFVGWCIREYRYEQRDRTNGQTPAADFDQQAEIEKAIKLTAEESR